MMRDSSTRARALPGEPRIDPPFAAAAARRSDDPSTAFARAELFGHRIESVPSPGHRMPGAVQRKMERALGADFSGIRVHEGEHVEQLGASAYTRGERIHFAPGQYRPHTLDGQRMIGHELAHVLQQRQGRARRGPESALNADAGLEAEADRLGASAAQSAGRGGGEPSSRSPAPASGPIQAILAVEGGRNYRRRVRRQMQGLLPPGVFVRTGAHGEMSLHHSPAAGAALGGPGGPPPGYTLAQRMIADQHRVRITPTDTRQGGVIRGTPENAQAPGLLANPGGWARHYGDGFLGNFSDNYRRRQQMAAAADPGRGTDHQIFYDTNVPAHFRQVRVHDPVAGHTVAETADPRTILAHELIHADRSQRGHLAATPQGTALFGAYDHVRGPVPGGGHWWDAANPTHDQELEEVEEMGTVGLPSAPVVKPMFLPPGPNFVAAHVPAPNDITENDIRAQLGLRRRSKYR
jgi:hypothetical protein